MRRPGSCAVSFIHRMNRSATMTHSSSQRPASSKTRMSTSRSVGHTPMRAGRAPGACGRSSTARMPATWVPWCCTTGSTTGRAGTRRRPEVVGASASFANVSHVESTTRPANVVGSSWRIAFTTRGTSKLRITRDSPSPFVNAMFCRSTPESTTAHVISLASTSKTRSAASAFTVTRDSSTAGRTSRLTPTVRIGDSSLTHA